MTRHFIAVFLLAGMLWLPASVVGQDTSSEVTIHVVQRGETLFRIAIQYGLTTDELAAMNGIVDPGNIQVGQRLLVPIQATSAVSQPETHVVQPGETLRSIAELYGMTVEQLAKANQIANPDAIYVGQVLNIVATLQPEATLASQVVSAAESVPPAPSTTNLLHTVQRGETLFRIATSYGLTVNDLARANNIADPTLIFAGQQLIIPGIEPPQLALDLPPSIATLDITPLIFVEGQTGRIRLTTTSPMTIGATFLDRIVVAASEQDNIYHTLMVGIPIFTEPGIYPLNLNLSDAAGQQTTFVVNIQIVAGNYGSEYITLLDDRVNLLDPNVENAELSIIQGVAGIFSPTRYWSGSMGLPAAASVISPFGRRRSYNGGPFDRFHSGTDFAGAPGTPILAAAPGYVVLSDTLNVRGNATVIDHGWGVFTGYWHQSERYVQVGDYVNAGQVIGTIGSTGRVSGAHLHWEVWVNGVPVEPMQWVQQSFS